MKEETAVENLREIKRILDGVGVNFWLDSGTLLGAIRDGKIIEWDSDVDLSTWYNYAERIISAFAKFKQKGFTVVLNRKKSIVTATRLGCQVEVDLYHEKGRYAWSVSPVHPRGRKRGSTLYQQKIKKFDRMFNWAMDMLIPKICARPEGASIRKSERFLPILPLKLRQFLTDMIWSILDRRSLIAPLVISKHHVQKLSTIRFYGMNVNVPFDVEKYLEYRYGSNWKISTKEWKYEDDGAIRSVRLCDFLADI